MRAHHLVGARLDKAGRAPRATGDAQARANDALWSRVNLVKNYAGRDLRPVEVMLLVRYREALSGRVLELGCGAGRVTGYLSALGGQVLGIDISPAMVSYCRRTYPAASFEQGDLRDLSAHATGSFGAVLAPCNVLDVLNDADRRDVVADVRRVLASGGLLIASSHNRASASLIREPTRVLSRHPRQLARNVVRLPQRLRNRRRLLPFQRIESEYAILNDCAHDYAILHYYVSREEHGRRLTEQGFELLECLDLDARPVASSDEAAGCPELYYVARRATPAVGVR